MDRIVLEGMEFHGYHGVWEEEARFGARFIVDVELFLPLSPNDDLEETVDYGRVYELVRDEVTGRRHRVIESLAHSIGARLLAEEPALLSLAVRVHKPHAPLPGVVRDVYVEVRKERSSV